MAFQIRHLNIDDYDALVKLWSDCGLPYRPKGRDSIENMQHEFDRAETCILGMFDGLKLIGAIVGTSDGRKGWINRLAIDPDYRGQCLASLLIKEAEKFLHGLGIKVFAALIESYNTPSMSAFTNDGYSCDPKILYFSKRGSIDD